MNRLTSWLRSRFAVRPAWMNALMVFAAFQVFVYSPWDILVKPLATDVDVWFGIMLTGWAAKVGDVLHLIVYAIGLYGFWRMRRWVRPWAALYVAQMAFSMFVWAVGHFGGFRGVLMGLVTGGFFAAIALALWRSRDAFRQARPELTK